MNLNGVLRPGVSRNARQVNVAKSLIDPSFGYISSRNDPTWASDNASAFFGTFTERSEIKSDDTTAGYKTSSTGILGGVSYLDTLANDLSYQLNFGLGLNNTSTATAEGTANSIDYHFGVGGDITSGPLTVEAAIGYSFADLELARRVGDDTATADTEARTLAAVIQASYNISDLVGLDTGTRLAPLMRLRGYSTEADPYTESGAGILNLNVERITSNATYAGIGFEFSHSYVFNDTMIKSGLNIIYDTKLSEDDAASASTITGVAGGFDTATNGKPDNLFSIDANVTYEIEENVEGFANIGATLGEDLQTYRGMVGMTIKF